MEAELENNIIEYLVSNQGYVYIKPDEMKLSFNRKYAFDENRLLEFIKTSQPDEFDTLRLDTDSGKEKFYKQLDTSIRQNGIVSVLKNGIKCYPSSGTIIFYHAIDPKRPSSYDEFKTNIFSVTNQLTYSDKNKGLELDLAIFVNGLPIITMELKSRASSSGWAYKDAEDQYINDRDPKESLFSFKRCIAHFAVDENFITFATKLDGKNTRFMPFNKGTTLGGSGNPINDSGTMTDYLWKVFLKKETLTSLIRDFAYISVDKVKKTETLIFPRYHQYRVVTRLVEDVQKNGVGKRYLIQHSAGSGKSNSITWLAYRLVEVDYKNQKAFDSVIVVTDRLNLDKQISDNIRKFIDEKSVVGHASSSTDLKNMLIDGKKIIITTVQKFPYLLEKIGTDLKGKNFAIIIDEAHSSQSGKAAASLNMVVSGSLGNEDEFEIEDKLNELIEARKMPENASFFAFTATPKAKTIQMFGSVFDLYSMKQAIEEGFILDVLKNYTHYENYYKIYKTIEENPNFDKKKAQRKIRNYVEGQEFPIREKSEVMVNHFLANTVNKINGKAKAMIVTQSILRAIEYYHIVSDLLKNSNTGYEALVAFSGEKEYKGKTVTETSLNGFSDKETPEKFKQDKYKFLIVADKYQTGYDEPLLHTMYVDKVLNNVKAVQTLSRLNRSAKYKIDTCVIDFANQPEDISNAFQPYYKETELEGETDPNKLNNLLSMLDAKYVYEKDEVNRLVDLFLENSPRSSIDSIVDQCVERYIALSEEDQVEFKSGVKSFIRTYNFLASILPIGQVDWEKKVIFFERLIHRLPTPKGDDLSAGILESIDLESYRLEKKNTIVIILEDEDGKVEGLGIGAGKKNEVELDTLENIVSTFNDIFGNIDWQDKDNVARQIRELPEMVMKNEKFKNALKNSDIENIKREYDSALKDVFRIIMKDNIELFGQWTNNSNFSEWLKSTIFDEIMKKNKR
ncbi:type I restriction endonuclease subunit R [Mesomycoplasma ovipneumoniae]|uniref:type I restriction endonuclease subunit R n=1 Tax=Mesomycoplasma ovipneumoniae TaxID=29562 RepID=UPI0028B10629|nr:type I restriction endonuclease [Mesomycoplasma ovipneumoniae]MDW2933689.1 type I restriction endonuclease [Mesomycoplasma ovipneumoniae]WNM15779.1 type I restriction endonuclease [Mesomycoplasma ovipneumoniae]